MWKTIVLCASLFSGAALGLTAVARWIEPSVLPAVVAIGLCLVGVVLILAAPADKPQDSIDIEEEAAPTLSNAPQRLAVASGSHEIIPDDRP